jgi:hypothetical protein
MTTKDPAISAIFCGDEEAFYRAINAEAKLYEDPAYCAEMDAQQAKDLAEAEKLGRIADAYLDAPDEAARAKALRQMEEAVKEAGSNAMELIELHRQHR